MAAMRVQKKNDWDYFTYTVGGVKIDERLEGVCDVTWPDGTVTRDVQFTPYPESVKTPDHGHTNTTHRFVLRAAVGHHGLTVRIPLEDLSIENVRQ
jgi:hypothetical protein